MSVRRIELTHGWNLRPTTDRVPDHIRNAGPIPASVPGTVHTDLLTAGLIDDPYLDDNEALQQWIGRADWSYRRTLDWATDGSERQELVFDGLDTIAEVLLNDRLLLRSRNMHRTYRVDVTGLLRDGENALEVRFASAIREADRASLELGARPHVNHHPYNAIRKMACSFGWDWGIDTATAGIWRPAALETWSTARIAELRVAGTVVDGVPTAKIVATIDRVAFSPTRLQVEIAGVEHSIALSPGGERAELEIEAPNAALWWPVGHGEAALHNLRATLLEEDQVLDRRECRIGFRTAEVRTEPDHDGIGFEIRVNGEQILVRGANWIPDDAFPHRVDRARYTDRIAQAAFARINLLRVWGGGIYESDDFYAECDARGILTWQDFLFACAAYAEEEPLHSEIEAEAREAVARLAAHPSLVVLNGNNENAWARQEWRWEAPLDGRTWGGAYYYDLLPRIVADLAPHVAYTPASPFSPDPSAPQNDPGQGTAHVWDLWNQRDYPAYREYRPRFVAEFGWQGPPAWSTMTRSISDDPLTPESPGMLVHQKAASGNDKLTAGLVAHLPVPSGMDDWHWAMSLNQAVAVRTAIEWFRSLTPLNTGSIVWQLNDCWPVTSWAAVDGDGRRKPLLFALRQANAERLLTIQPSETGGLRVVLVNDKSTDWVHELVVERRGFDGTVRESTRQAVAIAARSTILVDLADALVEGRDPASELVIASFGEQSATWFFTEYRDSALGAPALQTTAERTADGWDVHVSAGRLARDVTLLIDRLDPAATVDDGLRTLLPGESVTFHVRGAHDATEADFGSPLVLRSANDLLARP